MASVAPVVRWRDGEKAMCPTSMLPAGGLTRRQLATPAPSTHRRGRRTWGRGSLALTSPAPDAPPHSRTARKSYKSTGRHRDPRRRQREGVRRGGRSREVQAERNARVSGSVRGGGGGGSRRPALRLAGGGAWAA